MLLLAILEVILILCHGIGEKTVSESQMVGLEYLFNSTNGERWIFPPSKIDGPKWEFDPPTNPCSPEWQGITCDCISSGADTEDCGITEIQLDECNMRGVVPDQLSLLSSLTYLHLNNNFLNGTRLDVACGLPALSELRMRLVNLEGSIPSCLVQVTGLARLDVGYNLLTGTLPDVLGALSLLSYLDFEYNFHLEGSIPPAFCQATALRFLDLGSNQFTSSIPSCIGQLTAISHLALYYNQLIGTLPTELSLIQMGVVFLFHGNEFSGSLPTALHQLGQLSTLTVNDNRLSGRLPVLPQSMVEFTANINMLTGSLLNLALLPNLQVADLSHNALTGSLPANIAAVTTLQELLLLGNLLTGQLPESIGNISSLVYISVDSNMLTGTVPNITRLTALEFFYVSSNLLSGESMWEFLPLELTDLDISWNSFSGAIPFRSSIYHLENLYVRHNSFSGSIPASVALLERVQILDLSFNFLTGTISSQLNTMTALNSLLIAGNSFTGNLDSAFNDVEQNRGLITIDVGQNAFTGSLPESLFNSRSLREFFANSNCFTGPISTALCNATSLLDLDLSGMTAGSSCVTKYNSLIFNFYTAKTVPGRIPSCLFASESLRVLSLDGNGLRSPLGDMAVVEIDGVRSTDSRLANLSLSNNRIYGSIPLTILQYTGFEHLNLAYNHLSGTIEDATWYLNQTAIRNEDDDNSDSTARSVSIKLKSNRLSGNIPYSFRFAPNINILSGNMFACDFSGSELPVNDPSKDSYICGSSFVDGSMYGFAATVGLRIVGVFFISFVASKTSRVRQLFLDGRKLLILWDSPTGNSEVDQLHSMLRRYRRFLLLLLCMIWVVFTPAYLGLKSSADYSSRTYQYGWAPSLGFMKGMPPAVALFTVCLVLLPALVVSDIKLSRDYRTQDTFISASVARGSDSADVALWKGRYLILAIAVNVLVVVLVNGGYVYVVLTQAVAIQTFTLVMTSLFKTVWTLGVMNPVLRILNSSSFLLVTMTILNNIVIPVIGTILVDIDCYQKLFVPPQPIENDMVVQDYLCSIGTLVNGTAHCINTPLLVPTSFIPPFIYSGQCSNSLLTNYVPVYVTMFGMVNVMQLLCQVVVLGYFAGVGGTLGGRRNKRLELLHHCKKHLGWLRIASFGILSFRVLPIEVGDDLTVFHEYNCIPMYNLRQLGVNWVFGMLLILTFGVAYPPLSIVIFADLVLLSVLRQVCINQHLEQLKDHPDVLKQWEIGFKMEMGHLMTVLFNPKPVTTSLAAIFISLFLYDMMTGSNEHSVVAATYCAVLVGWGVLVSILYYYYEEKLRENALAVHIKSTIRRVSFDAVELAARPLSSRASWLYGSMFSMKGGDESIQVEVKNPIANTKA